MNVLKPRPVPLPFEGAEPPPMVVMLRDSVLQLRAGPRIPAEACAVVDPAAGPATYAAALARLLPSAMDRRVVLWRPGTDGMSFDEAWLVALADALERRDRDSIRFLSARRLRPAAAPIMHLLLSGLTRSLESF